MLCRSNYKLGDYLPFSMFRPPIGGHTLETVKNFDLDKFYGTWYDHARALNFSVRYKTRLPIFEYTKLDDGKVGFYNYSRFSAEEIRGVAYPQNGDCATLS